METRDERTATSEPASERDTDTTGMHPELRVHRNAILQFPSHFLSVYCEVTVILSSYAPLPSALFTLNFIPSPLQNTSWAAM